MSRRRFLAVGGAAGLCGLPACATRDGLKIVETNCRPPRPGPVVVDMHCHVMNKRDVDGTAFLNRRLLDTDETSPVGDLVAGVGSWLLINTVGNLSASRIATENALLARNLDALRGDYAGICRLAKENQIGVFFADSDTQLTGFLSDRLRNAARLMSVYDEVDLFTPSMVDLYEGRTGSHTSLYEQAVFLRRLNLITNGRFVPLVSFHPERQWREEAEGRVDGDGYLRPLSLVRKCLGEWGFAGVKVHPSSGFNPIDNATYGCPNTALQKQQELPPEVAERYDAYMDALFGICAEHDAPILTHSGEYLDANATCMHRNADKRLWTNAPRHWAARLKDERAEGRSVRVCLAHLAGGFSTGRSGKLRVHAWLRDALALMEDGSLPIYLDLSHSEELFSLTDSSRAFLAAVLEAHPDRLVYGSDWHMPGVAKIGRRYLEDVRAALPVDDQRKQAVMGGNALEFFRFQPGQRGWERMARFYAAHGVAPADVGWMAKQIGAG